MSRRSARTKTRGDRPKECIQGLFAQHQGNWNKIMNDDGMKGMGMLKAEAQEILYEAFRAGTLFSDYNNKLLKECKNANITAMKKMLQNEYQLNPTVCAQQITNSISQDF